MDAAEAAIEVVKEAYADNKPICFSGDNYSEEWHAEAEQRGLKNLKTTPDALLEVIADDSVAVFEKYSVLSKRELESRFEVWIEQYALRANIEAETTFSIAKTMLLPAALRHLALIAEAGVSSLEGEVRGLIEELATSLDALEKANAEPTELEGMDWPSSPATSSWPRAERYARRPTSWRRSWPMICGRCRSTRRCSSSSSAAAGRSARRSRHGREGACGQATVSQSSLSSVSRTARQMMKPIARAPRIGIMPPKRTGSQASSARTRISANASSSFIAGPAGRDRRRAG